MYVVKKRELYNSLFVTDTPTQKMITEVFFLTLCLSFTLSPNQDQQNKAKIKGSKRKVSVLLDFYLVRQS